MTGKQWKIDSKHKTYELADNRRKELLKDVEGLSVKVKKYRSDNTFGVKTRLDKQDVAPKSKKGKKNKKKNDARRAKRANAG